MYVNVARASLALVVLFALEAVPASAQSSLEFRVAQPAASARQGVVQTGGFKLVADDGMLLGPPSTPPEPVPTAPEVLPPESRSVMERGAEDGEVIYGNPGCTSCNGGCSSCGGGGPGCGGWGASCVSCGGCNGGCGGCNGGCSACNNCGGGCGGCGGGFACNGGCGMSCEGGCNDCGCNSCGCCTPPWYARCFDWCCHFLDHSQFFFASDGWKNRLDDDDANNFGSRFGVNIGLPLLPERNIGLQMGTSFGLYDLHGREDGNERDSEGQGMFTIGLFKRCCLDCCDPWTWAAVYDYQLHGNVGENGDEFIRLGQFRFLLGRALSECNEVGFWTAISGGDTEWVDGNHVRVMDQFNVYWRHFYESGADTSFFIGLAEQPGEFVFGFNGTAPLNSRLAMFGSVEYISPSASAGDPGFSEEVWNVSFGFVFYPGCNACPGSICGRQWMPVLPVADNGTFALAAGSRARL